MAKNRLIETTIILFGDILAFIVALWLTLLLRYLAIPRTPLFIDHLMAFGFIFLIWLGVFFIFDLYRRSVAIFRRRLTATILNAQIINSILAGLVFYLWPSLGLAPRVNLLIYLVLSFVTVVFWRQYLLSAVYQQKKEKIFFACRGSEVDELIKEIKTNPTYQLEVVEVENLDDTTGKNLGLVVFNPHDPNLSANLPKLYSMVFSSIKLVNVHDFYEEVFDRVPISIIDERWFLENISVKNSIGYSVIKRIVDIVVAGVLFFVSLIFYPIVYIAIKATEGGPVFFSQERVGKDNKIIKIKKFRSMKDGQVTKVGMILRKTRIDELPQLLSVIKGDLSLIGPRPEKPDYAETYKEEIPYYNIRHAIAPGLSGWAQLYHDNHPHFSPGVDQTREKLSYDLYYLKNRGLLLDLTIALKTLRILLSTKGI